MPWLSELALVLTRAVHLLALCVAPRWLSPEPLPPRPLATWGLGAAVALAAILALTGVFASRVGSRLSRAGGALTWFAVAAALGASLYFRGPHAPLARGVAFVAAPVWIALAVLASAAAEEWLGSSFKHRRMAAAVLVLGAGATLLLRAAPYLGSRVQLWWDALRRDPAHERAVHELGDPLVRKRKTSELQKLADRCLELHPLPSGDAPGRPATCACLALRAEARLQARAAAEAVADVQRARNRCPGHAGHAGHAGSRATMAEALALAGNATEAEEEARAGLEEGGDPARLRYALALALDRAGRRAEALEEVKRAIEAGAGRNAQLFAGALSILAGDLAAAAGWLEPLAKQDPTDAEALYNLALIADKRGDYNRAREGYLAALRVDPRNAEARYNVALLTHRAGVVDEARHHLRKFQDTFPDDPRGKQLAQIVVAPRGAGSPGVGSLTEPGSQPQPGPTPPPGAARP